MAMDYPSDEILTRVLGRTLLEASMRMVLLMGAIAFIGALLAWLII